MQLKPDIENEDDSGTASGPAQPGQIWVLKDEGGEEKQEGKKERERYRHDLCNFHPANQLLDQSSLTGVTASCFVF